jgi:hypothetical protein
MNRFTETQEERMKTESKTTAPATITATTDPVSKPTCPTCLSGIDPTVRTADFASALRDAI